MSRGLGYLYEDPVAEAARTNPQNWTLETLLATRAAVPVPNRFDFDLGPVLDQGSVGACVAFAATAIRNGQEHLDEGGWPFSSASGFTTYSWLKHGHGAFPGDGIPDVEGSYPAAVWKLAKVEGIPGINGVPRKIAEYYQLQGTPGSATWIDQQIQVMLSFGPVSIASAWPNNWWSCPASGLLPYPSGVVGGHMYVRKGFTLDGPTGSLSNGLSPSGRYWHHRQSWGAYGATDKFGRGGTFLLPFEADAGYSNLQVGEVWKTIDIVEGGTMLVLVDKIARLVDSSIGKNIYKADGVTVLSPIRSGPLNLASSAMYKNAAGVTYYAILCSVGGVPQAGWIKTADCFNVRPQTMDPAALAAAEAKGAKAVKDAAITEAAKHGG